MPDAARRPRTPPLKPAKTPQPPLPVHAIPPQPERPSPALTTQMPKGCAMNAATQSDPRNMRWGRPSPSGRRARRHKQRQRDQRHVREGGTCKAHQTKRWERLWNTALARVTAFVWHSGSPQRFRGGAGRNQPWPTSGRTGYTTPAIRCFREMCGPGHTPLVSAHVAGQFRKRGKGRHVPGRPGRRCCIIARVRLPLGMACVARGWSAPPLPKWSARARDDAIGTGRTSVTGRSVLRPT